MNRTFYSIVIIVACFALSSCCAFPIFPGQEYHCARLDWKGLVKDGKYEKAFSQLNKESIVFNNFGQSMLTYDILNVLVNKRSVKKEELLFSERYNLYPNSYAWTIRSFVALTEYLETGNLTSETVDILEWCRTDMSTRSEWEDQIFWIDAILTLHQPE